MNTIRKLFELINRILDTSLRATDATGNIVDELIEWTDEGIIESQFARKSLAADRAQRVADLEAKLKNIPELTS